MPDNPERMAALGDALRELTAARGLTQSELAERIGVDGSTVSRIFGGRRYPTTEQLLAICSALGLEPEDPWIAVKARGGSEAAQRHIAARLAGRQPESAGEEALRERLEHVRDEVERGFIRLRDLLRDFPGRGNGSC